MMAPAAQATPRSGLVVVRILQSLGVLPWLALAGIAAGGALWFGAREWADRVWLAALMVTGSVVVMHTVRRALQGRWATDLIAALAIVGAAVMDQPLAGLIVVLMQTGGEALERYAAGRASDALRVLEMDRPQHAHVRREGGVLDVAAEDVRVGDTVIVRPGELVPCDGVVVEGNSDLDTSRITGEPLPVAIVPGSVVMSGSINDDRVFALRATALAEASQYARIVELVRSAQETQAPFQRLAERYAVWFTPLTLVIALGAAALSGDWDRALAVLVVATPCPLILAPPIAFIGGINRAARQYVIVRNGAALERLARADVGVFDKTGTLTIGKPRVSAVIPEPALTRRELLQLAASVEQGSSHLLARTLVDAAAEEGIALLPLHDAIESAGRGVVGSVGPRRVAVGSHSYIAERLSDGSGTEHAGPPLAGLVAYVAVDGRLAGTVTYADQLRPTVGDVLADLATLGITRRVLLSGDHEGNVQAVAALTGITEAHGDLLPEDKVAAVRALTASGHAVLMVGDGTNDAPALTAASVGIALAVHGGGVTAEAADIVILVDDLARVGEAIRISRRTMAIARQSVRVGLTLSAVAMIAAAFGHIPPTAGALLQEVIDVAVILNALRASAAPSSRSRARGRSDDVESRPRYGEAAPAGELLGTASPRAGRA
jgi:heavy metal translocating P-type ATPase